MLRVQIVCVIYGLIVRSEEDEFVMHRDRFLILY
jgi:hypothetical protein